MTGCRGVVLAKETIPLSATISTARRGFHATRVASSGQTIQFNLADVGEGITECEVLKWHVKEGDRIEEFQPIAELQSDKANVEVTSRYTGKITKIHYAVGDLAKVHTPLVDILLDASESAAPAATAAAAPSPSSSSSSQSSSPSSSSSTSGHSGPVLTTPAVRRIAKEHNIDLSKVAPTGRDGRVLKEDVLAYLEGSPLAHQAPPQFALPTAASAVPPPPPSVTTTTTTEAGGLAHVVARKAVVGADREVEIRGLQRAMVKTMTASNQIPHFGYSDEIVVDQMVALRDELRPIAEARGVKLSYMPFILKAISLALKSYPVLNSSVNADVSKIIYKASHNLGVAMDTPQGLIVPNIKDVQVLTIFEIAQELNRLQRLGKEGRLGKDDLTGGTFTLSNIGVIGGTYAKPVLMPPEVTIGALGKIQKLPRFDERGNVVPTHIMIASWSADHRVIDGATMANFSNLWKNYLENPKAMLMDMQ